MSRLFEGTPFDKPKICPNCGNAPADCRCITLPPKQKMSGPRPAASSGSYVLDHTNADPPRDQVAKVRVEKRKGGREVTVIAGLEHAGNNLPALLTAMKESLGAGGSVQGRTVELQGNHARKAVALLQERGITARAV